MPNLENFKKVYLLDEQGLHLSLELQPPSTVDDDMIHEVEGKQAADATVAFKQDITQSFKTVMNPVLARVAALEVGFSKVSFEQANYPAEQRALDETGRMERPEKPTITVPPRTLSLDDAIQTVLAIHRDHPELTEEQLKNFIDRVVEKVETKWR